MCRLGRKIIKFAFKMPSLMSHFCFMFGRITTSFKVFFKTFGYTFKSLFKGFVDNPKTLKTICKCLANYLKLF